ncbi:hypothetical protein PENTCL1PPCAC_17655, partial [Pristionchus entomophagus]
MCLVLHFLLLPPPPLFIDFPGAVFSSSTSSSSLLVDDDCGGSCDCTLTRDSTQWTLQSSILPICPFVVLLWRGRRWWLCLRFLNWRRNEWMPSSSSIHHGIVLLFFFRWLGIILTSDRFVR